MNNIMRELLEYEKQLKSTKNIFYTFKIKRKADKYFSEKLKGYFPIYDCDSCPYVHHFCCLNHFTNINHPIIKVKYSLNSNCFKIYTKKEKPMDLDCINEFIDAETLRLYNNLKF